MIVFTVKGTHGLFPCCPRAGYLTLFESTGNVNVVYKEFRKFDKLLSKLVNGSLKKGKVFFFFFLFFLPIQFPLSVSISAVNPEIMVIKHLIPVLQQGNSKQWTHPGNNCGSCCLLIGWARGQGHSPGNRAISASCRRRESTWKCRSAHRSCSSGLLRWAWPKRNWNFLLTMCEWCRHTHLACLYSSPNPFTKY